VARTPSSAAVELDGFQPPAKKLAAFIFVVEPPPRRIYRPFLATRLQSGESKRWVAFRKRAPEIRVEKVNIAQKFSKITEFWKPYVAAELNGQLVKLDKLKGEFVWHHHDNEDELFLVVKGRFRMELRDQHIWIEEGEFLVVPRGIEHRPVADEECWIVLFEPASTLNTGNVVNERTLRELDHV
jgi:mannose-6-phosphate isomerase-like protein (cupin superfamily)